MRSREIFLASQYPAGQHADVSRVRSTLLSASLQGLKQMGWENRYFEALPAMHHEPMRLLIPGIWVPLTLAVAHYTACDRMGLSNEDMKAIGKAVSLQTQKTFVGTIGSIAAGAGVTPWHLYRHAHRIWGRIFDGGDHVIYKVGPKDLDIVCIGCPLLRIHYFRNAVTGYYAAIGELAATSVHCRELVDQRRDSSITLRISWV